MALFALLSGCAAGRGALREGDVPATGTGPLVAVAPMENRSNDLDASDIIRSAFVAGIVRRGYNVLPTAESDRLMREGLGINYGGQLKTTTPDEVCRVLGTQAVFYGEVLEWNKTTTGIYNSVVVSAVFRLYGADGRMLWEGNERKAIHDVPRLDSRNLGAEILVHAFGNLLLNPMTPHGKRAGVAIADKLPAGILADLPFVTGASSRGEGEAEGPAGPGGTE